MQTTTSDDILNAQASKHALYVLPSDNILNALWDTERDTGRLYPYTYFLLDTAGNFLTDPSGNKLVGQRADIVYPQILNAIPDDDILNSE